MPTFGTPGTWFGLPDLGITEGVSNLTGLFKGNKNFNNPLIPYANAAEPTGQVQGTSTYDYNGSTYSGPQAPRQQVSQPQVSRPQAPRQQSGGGGAGDSELQQLLKMQQSGGLNPSQQSRLQQLMGQYEQQAPQQQVQQQVIDFDAMIAPVLADLDTFAAEQQGSYQGGVESAQAWKGLQGEGVQQSLGAQQATLGTAKKQAGTAAESAADEAKRMYAEQQQGMQARYGKTTGTGQFASAQAGMATNRNIAAIRTRAMDLIAGFDDKLVQVKQAADLSLREIDQGTQDQIRQEKDRLDQGMQQIRNIKGQLVQRKAELAAQAVQIYQQTVQQINAANAKFKQDLLMQQMQAENTLKLAQQKANDVVEKAVNYSFTKTGEPLMGETIWKQNPKTGAVEPVGGEGYNPGSGLNVQPPAEEIPWYDQIANETGGVSLGQ